MGGAAHLLYRILISMTKPYSFLLIALLLVLISTQIVNVIRAPTLPPEVSLFPQFEFFAGLLWMLIFAWAALRLLRSVPHARLHALYMLLVFALYSVLRQIIFARADYDRQRIPFLLAGLVFTALIVGGITIVNRRRG
jgi:hypothetical protein